LDDALGLLETTGLTPALAALDVMEKTAGVRVLQAELNDFLGVCIKLLGATDAVMTALEAGRKTAAQMGGRPVVDAIHRVDEQAWTAIRSPREFNPLIQQDVVTFPAYQQISPQLERCEDPTVAETSSFALGLIETQGFTAVFEAVDSACKAASVEVVGKEKLGGGYVTVVIKGDVAAVSTAVQAGKAKVGGLGKLIAAHVIARPSPSVLSLLPQS
jgi:microcompartment protein CcmL/EutN